MKRIVKIILEEVTEIVKGQSYVACLHGDTTLHRRSHVIACEDVDLNESESCVTCRFENGNTYPYMKGELFQLIARYDVPSLANPRKFVGKNDVPFSCANYGEIIKDQIGSVTKDVEVFIDMDTNTARLMKGQVTFTFDELIRILQNMKVDDESSSNDDYLVDQILNEHIDKKIRELKKEYKNV
jgi:hypothetical protein